MRNWILTVCFLSVTVVCNGERNAVGQTFELNSDKAIKDVAKYYEENSILKRYDSKTDKWVDLTKEEINQYKDNPTYVISHGLNSSYDDTGSSSDDQKWISNSARAIAGQNKDALIVSVDWDHFSGTSADKNFAASTWINSVAPVLADNLGQLENIKSFVGHSYGAHLLAATMVEMHKDGNLRESKISFVALDPAEETLTFTGNQDGKPTWIGSDNKKSKNWNLPDNVTSETYKSSGFLGSEERLGDYNYFLASQGTITPRAVLGDLDSGLTKNHSLAPEWFAKMVGNDNLGGAYNENQLIGGWFNSETEESRKTRPNTDKGWDGIVNADTSVTTPKLEYSAGDKVYTEWQDLCNAEAQTLLYVNGKSDKSNWEGTVLKSAKYSGYKLVHGNDNPQTTDGTKNVSVYGGDNVSTASSTMQDNVGEAPKKVDTDSLYGAMGQEHPSEPTSNQELANEKYGEVVESITGDKDLGQKIKDLVVSKIGDAVQKGKDWIENGGIRDEIKKQVDKAIDGKVSDDDKQRILNLTDALCNVKDDGGKSLVDVLGTDGKDLAASLAVNEIKKQISSALPKDVADNVNAVVDAVAATGNLSDPAVKQKLLETVQSAVSEYLPYENSAKTINDLLQQIADGKGLDVIEAAKDLGKSIGLDALKDVVNKNLDPEAAAKVNSLIDGYAKDGVNGLTDAAIAEINAAIDKYAPGADSAAALKDVLQGMKDGTITADKVKDAVKAVGVDGAKALIDKSNLSEDAKKAAKEAVDAIAKDGWSGLTDTAQKYIQQYVTDKLGEEAGQAAGAIFDAIVTPGADVWDALEKNAPAIGEALCNKGLQKLEKWATSQLDKLIGKCPLLKKICDKLGINGSSVVSGLKNIWNAIRGKDLSEAFKNLSQMALDWLKDVAAKLIDWGVEELAKLVNQVIDKALQWVSDLLGKAANATNWGSLNRLILKLQAQLDAARTNGTIKICPCGVGSNVVNWIEGRIKKNSTKKKEGEIKRQ